MKYFLITITLIIMTMSFSFAQNDTDKNTALIIVDVQEFYFPDGFSPLVNPEAASSKAGEVLEDFRKSGRLVVHVKHATKKDSLIHPDVAPQGNEKIITKHYANSYRETELLEILEANNIEQVVVIGMMTHMCVEATARASADFGFNVIVLDDACATKDIVYGNDTVPAAQVHTTTLGSIDRYYGKVMKVDEFVNSY